MILVHFWWWLERAFGASNTAGVAYGFWSGSVSDLGELALLGSSATALIMLYKKINCHVDERPVGGKNCHKIGLHHVANGKYVVCKKHHPDMGKDHVITAGVVAKAHEAYNGR